MTVDNKDFVDMYTPTNPLELILKAKLGPIDAPYDEAVSDPFEIAFLDPCASTEISLKDPIPTLDATVLGGPETFTFVAEDSVTECGPFTY